MSTEERCGITATERTAQRFGVERIVSLLSCPFCGGSARHEKYKTVRKDIYLHHIYCEDKHNSCPADMSCVEAYTKAEAIRQWNTRAGFEVSDLDKPDLFAEILSALAMLARCGDLQQKKAKKTVGAVDMLKLHMGFLEG